MIIHTDRKPTTPGELLQDFFVSACSKSPDFQKRFLEETNLKQETLSLLLLDLTRMTPEIADSFGKIFDTSREFWMSAQNAVDEWELKQYE